MHSTLCKRIKLSSKWSTDLVCLIIFLASIAVRLFKLTMEPLLLRDGAFYLRLAEAWNKTGDYVELTQELTIVPPLPLWCIKTLMNFCGSAEIAGRSLSIFLGGLIPVIGFIMAKEIANNSRISLIAALCFIFHPHLVSYSIQPMRENYYILLIGLLLITMVWNYRNTRMTRWFVCGVIIGTAFFCRYEALEFLVIVLTEIAFLKLKKNSILPFFASVGIVLLAFSLTSLFLLTTCTDGDYSFVYRINKYSNNILAE